MKILKRFRKNKSAAKNAQEQGEMGAHAANAQGKGDVSPGTGNAQEGAEKGIDRKQVKFNLVAIAQAKPIPDKDPGVFMRNELFVLHGMMFKVHKITPKDITLRRLRREELARRKAVKDG